MFYVHNTVHVFYSIEWVEMRILVTREGGVEKKNA
jgi:hypothetical protein